MSKQELKESETVELKKSLAELMFPNGAIP
jgi:hypothetical protein